MKTLYRFEIQYSDSDGGVTDVHLMRYQVERETFGCYFIKLPTYARFSGKLKRVSKDAYNTFAFDTTEKAMEHFIRRTRKRIAWFEYWKKECEEALEIVARQGEKSWNLRK